MKRTHHCNELRPDHAGQTVTLTGWVHSRRDLGGVLFIDLRDRSGVVQLVIDPEHAPEAHAIAQSVRVESVLRATCLL